MNRALLLSAAAAAALSLAACNKASNTTANTASNTETSSTTNTSSNTASANPVNAAQDATGAAVGKMSASTMGSHDTGAFVSNAVQGNMYELEAAKIAEQRSKNATVKAFAKQMTKDHTALGSTMKPVIAKAGQTPPTDLDQRRSGMLDNLKSADASAFDKTYADQQVAAHDETLTLMQGYAKDGSDAGLKAAAAKTAPKVQEHLDMAKKMQAEVAGKAAK